MSELLNIQAKLADTGEMIVELEKELAASPGDRSVSLNLRSIEKRRRQLETEFADVSSQMGADVCRYRFLLNGESAKMTGIASNLVNYQSLVSVLYDAVKNGPKQNANLSADIRALTTFDFGYTFSGSVGFVLTVPNERLKGLDAKLDEAFKTISQLVKVGKPNEIRDYARRVGIAPIRALYRWANDHLKSNLSAEIELSRGNRKQSRFLVQSAQFQAITEAIAQTSDEERKSISVTGVLCGIDTTKKKFHFTTDTEDYKGDLALAVDATHPVTLPKEYKATISRIRVIRYSTEEDNDRFELTNLESI